MIKLDTAVINSVLRYEEVDSTNNTAKKLASEGAKDGTVVTANTQTAGKGRLGRSWASERGGGLFMSVILKPDINTEALPRITPAAAIAVCRGIARAISPSEMNPMIKWPNDVMLSGKKLCGILVEASTEASGGAVPGGIKYIVCGIGINVSNESFGEELKNATSLLLQTGVYYDKEDIMAAVLNELDEIYRTGYYLKDEMMDEYRRLCLNIGSEVSVRSYGGAPVCGRAIGISPDGALIVETSVGSVLVNAGEATFRV